jgi:hypothetical protein
LKQADNLWKLCNLEGLSLLENLQSNGDEKLAATAPTVGPPSPNARYAPGFGETAFARR